MMSSTQQESIQICQVEIPLLSRPRWRCLRFSLFFQPQERNIANKIFGGYLMRSAAELAFSCAFMYAQSQPAFVALDGTPESSSPKLHTDKKKSHQS